MAKRKDWKETSKLLRKRGWNYQKIELLSFWPLGEKEFLEYVVTIQQCVSGAESPPDAEIVSHRFTLNAAFAAALAESERTREV